MLRASEQLPEPLLCTRLHCSRCRYVSEHPGPVTLGDLDRKCGLCRAPLGAVTVYQIRRGCRQ